MKRRLKLKINGEGPRSLYLALVLAKLKCDVYIDDLLKTSNSKEDYQIFLLSNFSKNLLSKFDIWSEIEDIFNDFTSLSIKDNLVSEQLLLRPENFSNKHLNTIGWTAKYSDIKSLLINKLIDLDNVNFISNDQLIDQSTIFDYEFIFKNYNTVKNLFKLPFQNVKQIDQHILIFDVYLRGHVQKRLYEINTTKGLLVFTPLKKNLYQVIWNNASSRIKETSVISKSLLLDNLTTLLPNELKVDQIIGDIKFLNSGDNYPTYLFKNQTIYFNENKFKSNILYYFNFDKLINILTQIYNFLENNEIKNFKILNNFGFYYFLRKYVELKLNFSFIYFLFYLVSFNNIFSLLTRKLSFILLKRTNLNKFFVMRNINILNLDNFLK